ncbi:hypothetical protein ACLMJK_007000 [Lecanora helva]
MEGESVNPFWSTADLCDALIRNLDAVTHDFIKQATEIARLPKASPVDKKSQVLAQRLDGLNYRLHTWVEDLTYYGFSSKLEALGVRDLCTHDVLNLVDASAQEAVRPLNATMSALYCETSQLSGWVKAASNEKIANPTQLEALMDQIQESLESLDRQKQTIRDRLSKATQMDMEQAINDGSRQASVLSIGEPLPCRNDIIFPQEFV